MGVARLPGKFGLPIVGETVPFVSNPTDFALQRSRRHGEMFKTHIFGQPTAVAVGLDALQFVLLTNRESFSSADGWPPAIRMLIGGSLLTQEGEEHRRHRQLLAPAFHRHAVESYLPLIEEITLRHLRSWEQRGQLTWYDEIKRLTFENAARILFGTDPGVDIERLSDLFTIVSDGMSPLIPVQLPGTRFRRALRARAELIVYLERLVCETSEHLRDNMLSYMIRSYDPTRSEIGMAAVTNQALMLLYAGHESTTSLITSLCLELARHPEVMDLCRAEQAAVRTSGALDLGQLRRMILLDRVMAEIERLHPPFPGSFRMVVEPFNYHDCHVPAGWRMFCSIGATHRLEAAYAEPDAFRPDRYVAPVSISGPPIELATFGMGPRKCLGMGFAKLEAKVVASYLLQNYQWELLPGQRLTQVQLPTPIPRDRLMVAFRRNAGPHSTKEIGASPA